MSGISSRADEARRALDAPSHDLSAMTLALALGRRGLGQCWPNPSVGAVLADSRTGRVIGAASTGPGGRPHAEAIVLAAAGEAARGATLYATLEPCSHWGKTPPCADAVISSGIRRLVYGVVDPDPRVAGQGLARLCDHGVEVVEGPLPREVRWLALGHALRVSIGRPFVQLKLAVDSDGMIPAGDGAPQFVTSAEARGLAHLLRAETDAILIGHGTLIADDPELTCRLPGLAHRSPVRVVLSSRAELPRQAKMLRSAAAHPVWVIHASGATVAGRAELERLGVTLIPVGAGPDGRPDIRATMRALAERGITRLLVEGGPSLAAGFLAADLIDEALIFEAAARSQGEAIRPFGAPGIVALKTHTSLSAYSESLIGPDRLSVYRRAEFW
jgi:diaminohydroxyphosphoribosylaminopyrimidine deaminase / 5-amino-6-(5-phosphoribosylamino)uracil reductase